MGKRSERERMIAELRLQTDDALVLTNEINRSSLDPKEDLATSGFDSQAVEPMGVNAHDDDLERDILTSVRSPLQKQSMDTSDQSPVGTDSTIPGDYHREYPNENQFTDFHEKFEFRLPARKRRISEESQTVRTSPPTQHVEPEPQPQFHVSADTLQRMILGHFQHLDSSAHIESQIQAAEHAHALALARQQTAR